MREYGKISTSIWSSQKFLSLSDDAPRLLYLYLHTCPHGNATGCFRLPKGYAMADLGWLKKDFDSSIRELLKAGLVSWNDAESVVQIVGFMAMSPVTNQKHMTGAIKAALAVPDCAEKHNICKELSGLSWASGNDLIGELRIELSKDYGYTLTNTLTETDTDTDTEEALSSFAQAQNDLPDLAAAGGNSPSGEKPGTPQIPAQQIVQAESNSTAMSEYRNGDGAAALSAYNRMAARCSLPMVKKVTKARMAKIAARLKDCGGLDGWHDALAKVEASALCRGDNDRGWTANIDFLLAESSFTKLMEGNYDVRKNGPARNSTGETVDEANRRRRDAIASTLGL